MCWAWRSVALVEAAWSFSALIQNTLITSSGHGKRLLAVVRDVWYQKWATETVTFSAYGSFQAGQHCWHGHKTQQSPTQETRGLHREEKRYIHLNTEVLCWKPTSKNRSIRAASAEINRYCKLSSECQQQDLISPWQRFCSSSSRKPVCCDNNVTKSNWIAHFQRLCHVWALLRDSASLVEVTVTQACLTLFILRDSFWDMQGPLSPC